MDIFRLTKEDESAITLAIVTARRMLQHLSPEEIIGLGNALYALERMPEVTPGVLCSFGLSLHAGDSDFSELRYLDFRISETEFEIRRGSSTYSKDVGSDSFSKLGWLVEIEGQQWTEDCQLFDIESDIEALFAENATVNVDDGSSLNL